VSVEEEKIMLSCVRTRFKALELVGFLVSCPFIFQVEKDVIFRQKERMKKKMLNKQFFGKN